MKPYFVADKTTRQSDGARAAVRFSDEKGGILCRCGSIEIAEEIATAMNRFRMQKRQEAEG